MSDVAMPRLSDSMEEGTILKWLKSDGDEVSKGDELVEIETDKANMTYEADEAGTLSIVAKEGDTLAVGETIATIGEGGGEAKGESGDEDEEDEETSEEEPEDEDDASDDEEPEAEEEEPEEEESDEEESESDDEPEGEAEEAEPEPEDEPEDEGGENGRVKASPIARRMASDLGLDLGSVKGTGPGGRIVKSDIEAASKGDEQPGEEAPKDEKPQDEKPKDEPKPARDGESGRGEVTQQELTRLQRTVARRMAESKATAPDFVMTLEVDMEDAVEFRKQLKVAAGDAPAPSFNDFVIKASALALRDFPRANGAYRDGQFELYSRINVGVAVAGQDALVVPTVFDADKKSLGTIAAEARRLAERVREGKITPPELSSGTFTISNLGMYGIRRFVAVINPPQAAILAVGELSPRPVVRDGEVVIRAVMELTLTCDHRILYGADAAEFLAKIREYLEQPLRLAL
jgi:pyruvate dehydrogenase E2 component (dihydrolipoamide acetyltransferase)